MQDSFLDSEMLEQQYGGEVDFMAATGSGLGQSSSSASTITERITSGRILITGGSGNSEYFFSRGGGASETVSVSRS